jgi:hypothetical protein
VLPPERASVASDPSAMSAPRQRPTLSTIVAELTQSSRAVPLSVRTWSGVGVRVRVRV